MIKVIEGFVYKEDKNGIQLIGRLPAGEKILENLETVPSATVEAKEVKESWLTRSFNKIRMRK